VKTCEFFGFILQQQISAFSRTAFPFFREFRSQFTFAYINMNGINMYSNMHSWASAFRHQYFQSGTRPKKCRTALAWSGTGPVLASLVFSFRNRIDRMPDSPALIHKNTHTNTNMHSHTPTYDVRHEHGQEHRQEHERSAWTWTSTMDAGMPECR
jgi:hypothetical protein